MHTKLIAYKKMPVWTTDTLPQMFREMHNTKVGTWAKVTILAGSLQYVELDESGNVTATHVFDVENQAPFVEPQQWHRVAPLSDDLQCYLEFYCLPQDYAAKKYNMTQTHSEVINAVKQIAPCKTLDLGCGQGRNSLFLGVQGFEVDAWDHNPNSIEFLHSLIEKEKCDNIKTALYDINQAAIQDNYDFILSTVVLMFLQRDRIPAIIANMQQHTNPGGYNLIVAAMSTEDMPCPMPFSFTFAENELKNYYQDWELIKYTEAPGELHKTDADGNRIKLKFVTMLAKKV
ncbi:SAM-dependent methyltransferase TehB [Testudinibacter sp. TR-2022]|uniref:SAM-dependent methyltransferase TehB n=1 Tax=Testudinibacter sp. TR-2022 TaxID=2585029 RepID=UPI0011198F48|nr:SAM-dependent methyltransferase TehB [Testudinibacter sp. TR-2022]TNH04487.1 SAM-dependent methyltransferase TehB [Pasteurellaceae bacterium Phil31]TNH11991.1 SAM-dependent methyltransferase TehB [Testudinibacter sp. TR-2022]TNH12704.1 SAM-dependent methyltransferase TehB [Testudinibacter sp. TR-2022]TNH12779.1 SAM-dependent methyltransferase TehB [Testudinibacter sp. TR-2022]TNH19418.1 SAM-dependent methyltransferase TehB [Testudinibacter sp. TR-2022]